MKYFYLLVLFCNIAQAQSFSTRLEFGCDKTDKVMEIIRSSDYKEKMRWGGQMPSDQSVFSLWVNKSTKSWTLLKSSSNGYSCEIGAGTDSYLVEEETV